MDGFDNHILLLILRHSEEFIESYFIITEYNLVLFLLSYYPQK